jgi:hypothetical protein
MTRMTMPFLLALAACASGPGDGSEPMPIEPRGGGYCAPADPPAESDSLSKEDLERIEELPYWASAVADLPTGDEIFGNVLLEVGDDGRRILHVTTTSPGLQATMFVDIDVTSTLVQADGQLHAEAVLDSGPFGSVSFNAAGFFAQGALAKARFDAQSSGVFALTFSAAELTPWPPESGAKKSQKGVMYQLTEPVRVIGRLKGACMTTLKNGAQARTLDLAGHGDCKALLGGL